MTLVADESVDSGIIKGLRLKGIVVFSISEKLRGITDSEVLKVAYDQNCLLITEDKDFGELTFRLKLEHKGILLIRLSELPRKERIERATEAIIEYANQMSENFTVLTRNGLRIKSVKRK